MIDSLDTCPRRRSSRRRLRRVLAAILAVSCLPMISGSGACAQTEIIVSAAASLTQAMQAVGDAFEKQSDRLAVTFNFAASGTLLHQMAIGAPVDVFMSANQAFMDQAENRGLILRKSRRNFVGNRLVLAAAASAMVEMRQITDLAQPQVERIAIGHPETVPAGRYARQALTAAGVWEEIEAKLIFGNTVRQVLDYLRRGEVDAGLVYATDARIAGKEIVVATVVTTQAPVVYCLAITTACHQVRAARSFVDFVVGPQSQALLAGFGFARIEE